MQRIFMIVLSLSLAVAGTARAQQSPPQQSPVTIRPGVGLFAPLMPLVSVDDGENPDVELQPGGSAGIELGVPIEAWVEAYGGLSAVFTRIDNASSILELRDVDAFTSSRVNLYLPTAGVLLRPMPGSDVQPVIRLGAGAKLYAIDLFDVDDIVTDFTGDVGLGITAEAGPSLSITAEGRWLPSSFDPAFLPIRLPESGLQSNQFQNDWVFQATFAFRP